MISSSSFDFKFSTSYPFSTALNTYSFSTLPFASITNSSFRTTTG